MIIQPCTESSAECWGGILHGIFIIMQDKTKLYTTQQINKKGKDGPLKTNKCPVILQELTVFSTIIIHVFLA
jgi:hypothetical protein